KTSPRRPTRRSAASSIARPSPGRRPRRNPERFATPPGRSAVRPDLDSYLAGEQPMTPFRTILCAADFSERSKEAFRVACSLADERKTRLHVVHVVETMPVVEQPVVFDESGTQAVPGSGDQPHHEALKDRLRECYAPRLPIDVDYQVRD